MKALVYLRCLRDGHLYVHGRCRCGKQVGLGKRIR